MDGAHSETHSDSDSGESWTLLEASPSAATTPSPCPSPALPTTAAGFGIDGTDKDEDTDGISIISDSESESIAACEHVGKDGNLLEEPPQQSRRPTEQAVPNFQIIPQPTNIQDTSESTGCDDFLGDSTGKLKTYVHRRNKKVSSVLNVILLGSVITAAGVALGHMWGVREDCSLQAAPSVNKILSNLYKLQEENAFLRSKLRELTASGNFQLQKKNYAEKISSVKHNKCKKMFEEPLQNTNVVKTTKCLDLEMDIPKEHLEFKKTGLILPVKSTDESSFDSGVEELDFKNDIAKLKQIYRENKNWLDTEIVQRLRTEEVLRKLRDFKKSKSSSKENPKVQPYEPKVDGVTIQLRATEEIESSEESEDIIIGPKPLIVESKEAKPEKIVSYADSVKSTYTNKNLLDEEDSIKKKEDREIRTNRPEKKKYKRKLELIETKDLSDDDYEIGKDNRYAVQKPKNEKTKHDRQKQFKRQKRENKYEQWEMKGGYMKDFDSVTSLSSEENEKPLKGYDKNHFSQEWERTNYMNQFSELETNSKNKAKPVKVVPTITSETQPKPSRESADNSRHMKNIKSTDNTDWFEKRSAIRKQARERLMAEMLRDGKMKSSARWYFRRMSEREQCRMRNTNTTKGKGSKRNFNYKNKR